jgi:hypothetical protein
MSSTDPKPELTAKASMAQPVSQPAVYANVLRDFVAYEKLKSNVYFPAYHGFIFHGNVTCPFAQIPKFY